MLGSCIRYTPQRAEIHGDSADELGGEQEFHAYEKNLDDARTQFINERRTAASQTPVATYRVGTGDLIDAQVFGLPELNTRTRVRPSGTISLPLVQEVRVAGMTEEQVQNAIAGRLNGYVRNPRVKVFLEDYQAHPISVSGAVAKPGMAALRTTDYTLLNALAEAGGRTQAAGNRVLLIPGKGDKAAGAAGAANAGLEFQLEELYGNGKEPAMSVPLLPGDTVVVPEAGVYQVIGDVRGPGSFPLATSTTVLSAVAAAGGLEYSADVGNVEVIRDIGYGRKAALTLDLEKLALKQGRDVRLREGDVVRVPSQPSRFWRRQAVEFLNGFFNVGVSKNAG